MTYTIAGNAGNRERMVGPSGTTMYTYTAYTRLAQANDEVGRFISRDPVPGLVSRPYSLNPYLYADNDPVNLVDPDGKIAWFAIVPIILVAAKVIDYAWTAWDAYQAGSVLADPCASAEDRRAAAADLAAILASEALEPDDLLPIGLPLGDIIAAGRLAQRHSQQGGGTGERCLTHCERRGHH